MEKRKLNRACIAIGSNIEPRESHLLAGIDDLRTRLGPDGSVVAVSRLLETDAVVLPGHAPGQSYLNGACVVETSLLPREFLNLCLDIERAHGRDRHAEGRWGARTLDMDLLLFGSQVIHEPGLEIPHPRMLERRFVLEPLAEIAGNWVVPSTSKNVKAHLDELRARAPNGAA